MTSARKLETIEEVENLPVGSKMQFEHFEGDSSDKHGSRLTGTTYFIRELDGWYVVEAEGREMHLGPYRDTRRAFLHNYAAGEYFCLVAEDTEEGEVAA